MSKLYIQTVQLWPTEARRQLKERRISVKRLRKLFAHIVFPWDPVYNSYRFFYKQEIAEFPLFVVVFTRPNVDREALRLLNLVYAKQLTLRITVGRHSSAIQNPHVYADISELNRAQLLPPLYTSSRPSPLLAPILTPVIRSPVLVPLRTHSQPSPAISVATPTAIASTAVVVRATIKCDAKRIKDTKSIESSRPNVKGGANGTPIDAVRIAVEGGMTQGQVYRFLFECVEEKCPKKQKCASTVHFLSGHLAHPVASLAIRIDESNKVSGETGFLGGAVGSVGANALLSCGGIGTLHRTFGLATDRVESFRIALPPSLKHICSSSSSFSTSSLPRSSSSASGSGHLQSRHAARGRSSSVNRSDVDGRESCSARSQFECESE
jgi:hypothetical protein